jgi:hypothetical protein
VACNPIITPGVQQFIRDLDAGDRLAVMALIAALKEHGFGLTAPLVKRIVSSDFHNLKELRKQTNDKLFRILFAFDINRDPILLYAGDKREVGYDDFYTVGIPIADQLFKAHQKKLKDIRKAAEEDERKRSKVKGAKRPKKGK